MTKNNQFAPESVLQKNAEKLSKLQEYVVANMINRPYHNIKHIQDTIDSYALLAQKEALTAEETFLGLSAMTAHDLICIPYRTDNEERTIEKVKEVFPKLGYSSEEIEIITPIIYATKLSVEPKSKLEMIAKDADLSNLGRDDFYEKNEALRVEYGIEKRLYWLKRSLDFLLQHRYYTKSAKELGNEGKKKNILSINDLIEATLDIAPSKISEILRGEKDERI